MQITIIKRFIARLSHNHIQDLEKGFKDLKVPQWKISQASGECRGLFGMRTMASPEAFHQSATDTLTRCKSIVSSQLNTMDGDYSSLDGRRILKAMDTLSDMLCTVVDAAECVRHTVISNDKWQEAAQDSYSILGSYINELNTNAKLYQLLRKTYPQLTDTEDQTVSRLLQADLEKYGAQFTSSHDKLRVIRLSDEISQVGYQLACNLGLDTTPKKQSMENLREMLQKRHDLSQILGHETFAELNLKGLMAGRPSNVYTLLDRIRKDPHSMMFESKSLVSVVDVSQEYSLPSIMQAASRIFSLLFGLRIEMAAQSHPNEFWSSKVRKLSIINDDNQQLVGTIYIDFASKTHIPAAQFTVRCSRQLDNDPLGAFSAAHYEDISYLGICRINKSEYQLPVVVLSCDFPRNGKTHLQWNDVETLFHELGHALHSMCAQRRYQHVSGTRAKLDFVEVPSILMEYLIRHPLILSILSGEDSLNKFKTRSRKSYRGDYANLFSQIYYAELDLRYHDSPEIHRNLDKIASEVKKQNKYPEHAESIISHFYNYGSAYYSYLWSRVIAHKVYLHLFEPALDSGREDIIRNAGQIWIDEVLSAGGAIEPAKMNWARVLGGRELNEWLPLP